MVAIIVVLIFVLFNDKMHGNAFDLQKTDEQLFIEFVSKFDKKYRSIMEEEERFSIFKKNLEIIRELNKKRSHTTDAFHDINTYTDQMEDELPTNKRMNIPITPQDKEYSTQKEASKTEYSWNQIPPLPAGDNLPQNHAFCGDYVSKNVDRPKIDFCGEVISQNKCGGCWATSLANLAQYLYSNLTYVRYGCIKPPTKFAVQRFLDVATTKATKRCCGGHPRDGVRAVPSFSLEADYPFIDGSNTNVCTPRGDQNPNVQIQMAITGFQTFGIPKDQNMVLILKKLLHHYGPFLVSVKVTGTGFSSYSSGIFQFPIGTVCDTSSSSFMTDHEVVLMGWGVEQGVEYFIIRNSWASGWGEGNNYMRVKTTNLCGIGWRIGDYVYPLNMLVFANTCKLDKNCNSCNISTNKCSSCSSGYYLNSYNRCVLKTLQTYPSHQNDTSQHRFN